MSHPFLRPMTAGEILLVALRAYGAHFRLLVLVALFPHLALLAWQGLLLLGGEPSGLTLAAALLGTVVSNGVALAALTVAIGRVALGQEPTLLEVYAQTARSRLGAVVAAYLITAVLISAGLMALLLPGVLLGALFAPVVPIIVLERRGAADAVARAVQMMKSELMKGSVVFAFFILMAGLLPLLLLIAQSSLGVGPLTPLLSAILGSVTLPLGFTANAVLYFSLRAPDEGAAAELEAALRAPET